MTHREHQMLYNNKKPSYTPADLITVAKTVYGEARGEPEIGQIAVIWVIRNRAALAKVHTHFGDGTLGAACLAKWQFSCWNHKDPNCNVLHSMADDDPRLLPFVRLATHELSLPAMEIMDPTSGATHYYARTLPHPPKWAESKTPRARIGNHLFFGDIA